MSGHGQPRRYNVLGQDLGGFKPFVDRAVPVRSIPCPVCGVAEGAFCVGERGQTRQVAHPARRRMVVRAQNRGG